MSHASQNARLAPSNAAPTIDDPSKIRAWAMYDWGNSAFSTTVMAVVLATYLTAIVPDTSPIKGAALFSYTVSASVLISTILAPILGAIADYANRKKWLWTLFTILGSVATIAMYFITAETYGLGVVLLLVANVCFSGALVFYNAFLPQVASEGQRDRVSSLGFALGYIGGGILLAINLALILSADKLGITTGMATRISLASAGVWWLVFSIPMWRAIHDGPGDGQRIGGQKVNYLTVGFTQLKHTFAEIRRMPQTLRFLIAFLIYNDGIQTVITTAAVFGQEELGLDRSTLIGVVLMIQFIAFGGAFLFGWLSKRFGPKRAIMLSLVVWSGLLIYAFAFIRTAGQFWILGGVAALVLGGSQALSRSLFSQMIPPEKSAEYFGFYEISDKFSSILGPIIFATSVQLTNSYRTAIFSLIVFFIVGLVILAGVNVRQGIAEAKKMSEDRSQKSDIRFQTSD